MGIVLEEKTLGRPTLNGKRMNAFYNGKRVWIPHFRAFDDPYVPPPPDLIGWAPVVLVLNSPNFIIPTGHLLYDERSPLTLNYNNTSLNKPYWNLRPSWEISIDLGEKWIRTEGIRSINDQSGVNRASPQYTKGGPEITNIPKQEDGKYYLGIRPAGTGDLNGWFGNFGGFIDYKAEYYTAISAGGKTFSAGASVIPSYPSGTWAEAFQETNRRKLLEIHLNDGILGVNTLVNEVLLNYLKSTERATNAVRYFGGFLNGWLAGFDRLQVIDIDTSWFTSWKGPDGVSFVPEGWRFDPGANIEQDFKGAYNFTFLNCRDLRYVNPGFKVPGFHWLPVNSPPDFALGLQPARVYNSTFRGCGVNHLGVPIEGATISSITEGWSSYAHALAFPDAPPVPGITGNIYAGYPFGDAPGTGGEDFTTGFDV